MSVENDLNSLFNFSNDFRNIFDGSPVEIPSLSDQVIFLWN